LVAGDLKFLDQHLFFDVVHANKPRSTAGQDKFAICGKADRVETSTTIRYEKIEEIREYKQHLLIYSRIINKLDRNTRLDVS